MWQKGLTGGGLRSVIRHRHGFASKPWFVSLCLPACRCQLIPQVCTSPLLWLLSTSCTDCRPCKPSPSVPSYWAIKEMMHRVVRLAEVFCPGVLTCPCFPSAHDSLHLYHVTPETRAEIHLRAAATSHVFVTPMARDLSGYRRRNWGSEFMIGHPCCQLVTSARMQHGTQSKDNREWLTWRLIWVLAHHQKLLSPKRPFSSPQ